MSSRLLIEGNKIDFREILTKTQIEDGIRPETYASQILEIRDEYTVVVSMPMLQGRLIPLSKGKKYQAFFYTLKGLYNCDIIVKDRHKNGNMYTMTITLETELCKYQRRQYYRLDKSIQIYYTILNGIQYETITQKRHFPESLSDISIYETGNTLDISGGGMRFIGPSKIETGKKILVVFDIVTDGRTVKFRLPATVIMSFSLENRLDRFEHRICFENISNAYREILIKYIFEEERKLRRSKR